MNSTNYRERIINYVGEQFELPEEQVRSMLPEFISTLSLHMHRLEDALEESNPVSLAKAGHTLKGALLNLGLTDCAALALQIERGEDEGSDGTVDYPTLVAGIRGIINGIVNE